MNGKTPVKWAFSRLYGNFVLSSVGGMEAILNCRTEDLEDYYGLLGCDQLSTTEQIVNEFKVKALACHPDKHPENPKAVKDFQKLQEAKEVLTDEKKRKSYDLWLRSQLRIPFSEWLALSDSVKTSMHWAMKSKKEPMLEAAQATNPVNPLDGENTVQEKSSEVSSDYWYQRFRWAGEAPSGLLQKFRNYEI